MGFLGFSDYNSNGPGVSKHEPKKNAFFRFWDVYIRKFWRLIPLNIIFLLSCCTVVLAGPAMAGFSYVLRNFSLERHAFVWEDFYDTAKKNFKQSLAVGLINLVLFFGLGFAVWFWYSSYTQALAESVDASAVYTGLPPFMYALPLAVCFLGLVMLIFMQYYMYLILVTFDINLKKLYKNSLILAFYGLPRNILITIIIIVSTLFVISVTSGGYLAISVLGFAVLSLLYFSFVGLATVCASYPLIQKTMIDPYQNIETENAPVASETEAQSTGEAIFSDDLIDSDKRAGE